MSVLNRSAPAQPFQDALWQLISQTWGKYTILQFLQNRLTNFKTFKWDFEQVILKTFYTIAFSIVSNFFVTFSHIIFYNIRTTCYFKYPIVSYERTSQEQSESLRFDLWRTFFLWWKLDFFDIVDRLYNFFLKSCWGGFVKTDYSRVRIIISNLMIQLWPYTVTELKPWKSSLFRYYYKLITFKGPGSQ